MDNRIERLCAWSGFAMIACCFTAYVPSHLVPVLPAGISAEELEAFLIANKYPLLMGMVVQLFGGTSFLWTWCVGLAYSLKRHANAQPLLVYLMVAMGGAATMVGVICGCFGSLMVFRVGEVSPEIPQMAYDMFWFFFLIPWPPFTLWALLAGVAILSDTRENPVFPRWSGYMSLWAGLVEAPAALCVFYKTGPFSYNGAITWWVPTVSFFFWVVVMAVLMIKASYRTTNTTDAAVA